MTPLPDALREAADGAPVPEAARRGLERLVEAQPDAADRLADDPALLDAATWATSASRSLTRLLEADPGALDVLADLDHRPPSDVDDGPGLERWKRRELLRIAARDLVGTDGLEATGAALAHLGADVLDLSCRLAGAEGLAVIGMGKLGGTELNYASDIDVLFVGDGDPDHHPRQARAVLDLARTSFRVDANLRPEGRDGPLSRSVASYVAYWDRWAQPWEFQALLKAQPVGGDPEVGSRWAAAAITALWERTFDADDIRSVRDLKVRAEAEVAKRGLTDREIKRGRGGIRDVEFALQLLQLVHGRLDPGLRSPNTLELLDELAGAGYVDAEDAAALADGYRFLRRVEHRLQLEDERQVHAVPPSQDERSRLARVLGYRGDVGADALEQFDRDLAHHQATVRSIHERLYFRPLLEAFAGTTQALSPEAAAERLSAFGFTDVERTRQAVLGLTRGLTRSSRLMQQLLPLLLDWLSQTPDPDLGLLALRSLADQPARASQVVAAFRESPEVARALCRVVGTSRMVGEILQRNPDLIARLADPDQLRTQPRPELVASATAATAWREDRDERQEGLRRWRQRHLLGVAARDLLDEADTAEVGRDLTALAETTLEVALAALEPTLPFAIVAVGRLGGEELSYASDLDVLFVYDGDGPADFEEAERLAVGLRTFVIGSTPAQRLYDLDLDLRPEGKQGPLARSLIGYHTYFSRWGLTWERQAMTRARAVAGDLALGRGLVDLLAPFVWQPPDDEAVREIRRMKARIEQERIPPGEDPDFHLKLGRGSLSDVEFTVQLLALRHDVRSPGAMAALGRLEAIGAIAAVDAAALREAYAFCERTRNRWYLVSGAAGDALPQDQVALGRLARSLGTSGSALRNEYRRVTRRSRQVVQRLFYGVDAD